MLSIVMVSSSAGIISATSTIGAPQLGILGIVALIVLLSIKAVLSASRLWNKRIACSLNMSIIPLLIAFLAIVAFKIMGVLK